MVSPGLRELLERGDGVGVLEGAGVAIGAADHPVCGDRVQLSVRVIDGVIRELRWQAAGCPASMAVAALAAQALVDVDVDRVDDVLHRAITERGGLKRHEHHAEAMVLRALRAAFAS